MKIRPDSSKKQLEYTFNKKKQVLGNISTHLEVSQSFLIKPKKKADTRRTIVMCCGVFIRNTQRHIAGISAGSRFLKLPVYQSQQILHGTAAINLEKPVQSKQRVFNYVYQKGSVFPPIQIESALGSLILQKAILLSNKL